MIYPAQCSTNYQARGHSALVGVEIASDCMEHLPQPVNAILAGHLAPLVPHDLGGKRLFQLADPRMQIGGACGLGVELADQPPLPVRQAEDLAGDDVTRRESLIPPIQVDNTRPGYPRSFLGVHPPVLLQFACAANPFDFWPLIERGFAEWSRTSDALIDGVPFEGALGLFRRGLGNGTLDLFLGFLDQSPYEVVESRTFVSLHKEVASNSVQVERAKLSQNIKERSAQAVLDCQPVIFDVVSVFHGYLQGHLLWVAPEYRGRGLVGQYFDAALAVAGRHGLKGFMFLSTLPFWEWRAPRYGFEARGCIRQSKGPDVIGWFREATP